MTAGFVSTGLVNAVSDRLMGTDVRLVGLPPALAAEAFAELRHAEQVFSRFHSDSDTSRVNAAAGGPVRVSPLFAAALQEACAHSATTGGLFSPLLGAEVAATGYDVDFGRVPGRPARPLPPRAEPHVVIDHDRGTVAVPAGVAVDLGGFVKGWAAQRVAAGLRRRGVPRGLIDAGGDVVAWHEAGGIPWEVVVAEPGSGTVALGPSGAVATSSTVRRSWTDADGVRRHHVIDPRTGLPADSGCVQATVAAPDLATAEVLATCMLVLGPEEGPRLLAERVSGWCTVDTDGHVRRGGGVR
jgi:thiamine biosynthesis lipoprotein